MSTTNALNITAAGLVNYSGAGAFSGLNYTAPTTFTPTLTFGGGSTGITYAIRVGTYSQIAKLVFFDVSVVLTNKGSSTGAAAITGLPVTSKNDSANYVYTLVHVFGTIAGATYFYAELSPNSSTVNLNYGTASSAGASNLTDANFTNASIFRFCGSYLVD